ncbi:MAG: hypothetical protein KJ067_05385 [Vicinamibacteria bacterium]|nr:hypothetical protein [Vicinamibacteria bacterium]
MPNPRWIHVAHALLVAVLFAPTLFLGEMPYFRDVVYTYWPDLEFLSRSLRTGTFPLWHPGADGGAPFFAPYPPHLLLAALFGGSGALRLSTVLHVLLAASGASELARQRGTSVAGAIAAGVAFGLGGVVLSSLLYPVFLAAAWMPWLVRAWLRLLERPTPPRAAALALLAAVQLSTFGAEVCLQTAVLAFVLQPPRRKAARALLLSAVLFAALAAPVLLGARAMAADTARAAGFPPTVALAYSAAPAVLAEALVPGFFGDLRGFSASQFWGASLHPNGFPFFVSLYQGPLVLLFAVFGGSRRLWVLSVLGLLLALGSHGPFAPLLAQASHFRAPVKFVFLASLSLSLLAGAGLDRVRGRRPLALALCLAVPFAALGVAAAFDPRGLAGALAPLLPPLGDPHAAAVIAEHWPRALLRVALLMVLCGALVAAGRARIAPLLLAGELVAANAGLVPSAPVSHFALRPEVAALLAPVRAGEPGRLFSCGLCGLPSQAWRGRPRTDLPLFALERQALAPRAHVLDGLDGAFDEDRMGLTPPGAALPPPLRDPTRIAAYHRTLALGNVRWVLSWRPLPPALAIPRGEAALAEVDDRLGLYELVGALPRAYWVPRGIAVADRRAAWRALRDADERAVVVLEAPALPAFAVAAGPAEVSFAADGPHRVRVRARTPPGFVVLLDGFGAGWRLEGGGQLWRANGRYRAWWTPGGAREFTLVYAPGWRVPALAGLALGVLGVLVSALTRRLDTSRVDA